MLDHFYAVTASRYSKSIYLILSGDKEHKPLITKIELSGKSKVGSRQTLERNAFVGIASVLIPYGKGDADLIEFHWGEYLDLFHHTSYIVGLFLTDRDAYSCYSEERLVPADERWIVKTKEVLDAIGFNHPKFKILREADGTPVLMRGK